MTYPQTLEYLFSKLPMYQRIGAAAYKADLNNTIAICAALGNPEKKLKCIHVAGTNGKGSSSHMLAAVLQKSGYKTGLYTSPHLVDFRERIKINGKPIPKTEVTQFVESYKDVFEKIEPSFFEWTVGLAFDYFVKQEVDVAVIEVGLGGRLDSTNVIKPIVSLITNISFDHMNLLGDTLPKIGEEKAGIIKTKTPVVISQTQLEVISVFNNKAKELKAPIVFADKQYKVNNTSIKDNLLEVELTNRVTNQVEQYKLDLTGSYQVKNLIGVLSTISILREKGFMIEEADVKSALEKTSQLTGLMGRWQTLSTKPLIIADTGHNEDGILQVIENIKKTEHKQLHFVLGVVNDKDISKILKLLPKEAVYYFCKASIPRALDENELFSQAKKAGLSGKVFSTVPEAIKAAKKQAKSGDLVFIGGSTFTVADALPEFVK